MKSLLCPKCGDTLTGVHGYEPQSAYGSSNCVMYTDGPPYLNEHGDIEFNSDFTDDYEGFELEEITDNEGFESNLDRFYCSHCGVVNGYEVQEEDPQAALRGEEEDGYSEGNLVLWQGDLRHTGRLEEFIEEDGWAVAWDEIEACEEHPPEDGLPASDLIFISSVYAPYVSRTEPNRISDLHKRWSQHRQLRKKLAQGELV